jgi:hypothetical protein
MCDQVNLKNEKSQEIAKYGAIGWTIAYLLLLPYLLMLASMSVMVFDSPYMSEIIGNTIRFLMYCVPLSVPVTIYLIWSNYLKGQYRKSCLFWFLPLIVFGVTEIIMLFLW